MIPSLDVYISICYASYTDIQKLASTLYIIWI